MSEIAAVLLVAGQSRRMGRPKALLPLGGLPLCRHAALALVGGGAKVRLAVIPPGEVGEALRAALGGLDFTFVVQPQPGRGLLASFQAAIPALPVEVAAMTVALADMPFVSSGTHQALHAAHAATGAPLVLTRFAGVGAPPHLFGRALWPELLALPDADRGPRDLLRRYGSQAVHVERPAAELFDIDTPQALAEAQRRFTEAGGG